MTLPEIRNCPGTLAEGYATYSRTALKRVFFGKKVSHILPYVSPASYFGIDDLFNKNRKNISISGVQEKFSVVLDKNKLRLANEKEQGMFILKPIPFFGKKRDQMPANEHLTMQIARQVYKIETAENALIFFENGEPAYITKRFDIEYRGNPFSGNWTKLGQEDFASIAERTPYTFGENYKYAGCYFDFFELMRRHLSTYKTEAPKLFKILVFNYLFSNGDAHYKNFSILETPMGDYRLSPAYDLLNSRIHIDDSDFALEDGLLPKNVASGKIGNQFIKLAEKARLNKRTVINIFRLMMSKSSLVEKLINASYLDESTGRNYLQSYQARLNQLKKTNFDLLI